MENNNTLAVQGTAKLTNPVKGFRSTVKAKVINPVKRFLSAVNAKRKKVMLSLSTMVTMAMVSTVSAFAEGEGGGGGGSVDGEAAFNSVIGFFATWIGRIGLVVAFVGGIMFALAIKNDDAEAKTRGLMTLASGFVVFALTLSLDLFGITA